ncbi:MAG TPA: NAD(+) synthase [Gemmatales bacterium]|nr:NAD(+) synthase [Gemmatales bacterium]HMP58670.1 NAD(+) synthase [Gemmatales bacterium]
MPFYRHGFLRVGVAAPLGRIADPGHNADQVLATLERAEAAEAAVVIFPELFLTSYTCGDLFQQETLRHAALDHLDRLTRTAAAVYQGLFVVGVPLMVDDQLYNAAAVIHRGRVLGVVPKAFLPSYREFYEHRWFAPARKARSTTVTVCGQTVPFGLNLLFVADDVEGCRLGVEICEDLWTPIPPSSHQAIRGATLLANLSASNEVIGKAAYRRQLVANQSGRCMAAYLYSSAGVSESSTDLVFSGHCLIAENGVILAEAPRFQRADILELADVDLGRLQLDRVRTGTFGDANYYEPQLDDFRLCRFELQPEPRSQSLRRWIDPHPFVPKGEEQLKERCEEIFSAQVAALGQRLLQVGRPTLSIGISGGLDSTLALLVACKTVDSLSWPRSQIQAWTMPGFGTTNRTLANAQKLMQLLEVRAGEADIRGLCLEELQLLGHQPFGIDPRGLDVAEFTERLRHVPAERRQDLVFENVQARMRTQLLMNSGFVIGTGDLSELALGWCTYNGDHMSMYNPNVSIPKTLVKFLVRWAALNEFSGTPRETLLDVVATEISPELLPTTADGLNPQSTEAVIGPYEVHDFFLYHFIRHGAPPAKMLFLAEQAEFDARPSGQQLRQWLRLFLQRFFASQFKRSCLPDGPKVGSVSLSPRGDWRMPSDAAVTAWLASADE